MRLSQACWINFIAGIIFFRELRFKVLKLSLSDGAVVLTSCGAFVRMKVFVSRSDECYGQIAVGKTKIGAFFK